ncbi:hypothetical protein LINPERPRIM_LOCUS15667 [Linum perenne]
MFEILKLTLCFTGIKEAHQSSPVLIANGLKNEDTLLQEAGC